MNLRRYNSVLLFSLIVAVFLTACTAPRVVTSPGPEITMPPAAPPPAPPVVAAAPPPPVYAPAPAPAPSVSKATLTVRDFLYPEDKLDQDVANLILFARKPANKAERDVYVNICETWKATFPDSKEVNMKELPQEFLIVRFYWMLKSKKTDVESCDKLVGDYDYGRAKVYLTKMKLKATKNQMVCQLPNGFVVMDINALKKTTDITLAVTAWQNRMTIIPTKGGVVHVYTLFQSAKVVLGALGSLITLKI